MACQIQHIPNQSSLNHGDWNLYLKELSLLRLFLFPIASVELNWVFYSLPLLTQLSFTLSQHIRENRDVQNLEGKTENKTTFLFLYFWPGLKIHI